MVRIYCAIVGSGRRGDEFEVDIGNSKCVYALKEAIKAAFPNGLYDVEASSLQLFEAKRDDRWLQSCSEDVKKLAKGEKTDTIKEIMHEDKELQGRNGLANLLETMDNSTTSNNIDVLVVVPYAVKRQRIGEETSIAKLCRLSKLQLQTFPFVTQLQTILEKPLPFRLTLRDSKVAKDIFNPNSPLLSCPELETAMDYFLDQCQRNFRPQSKASVGSWQKYYDILLSLTTNLYREESYDVLTCRNPAEGTTLPPLRPNFVLQRKCLVLMRGEEQSSVVTMSTSVAKLKHKMRVWSVILYADLPYVLGYATSGSDIQFVVMEESGGACRPTPILKCDILFEKALALKVFYNLAFLLDQMERLAHRSASFGIVPFYPDENEKRKIEMLDNMIERTITRNLRISKEDLDRLAKIYKSLETLSEDKGSLEMHLQTVENFNVTTTSLTVRLSPLGDMRKLSEDEICACVRDILTALKYWHSTGYCHGDVRWRNIALVPPSYRRSNYWMLLDMDESWPSGKHTIDWNHPWKGQLLRFQHDLYELGDLLKEMYDLPAHMEEMRAYLLSALDGGYSAEDALARLESLCASAEPVTGSEGKKVC